MLQCFQVGAIVEMMQGESPIAYLAQSDTAGQKVMIGMVEDIEHLEIGRWNEHFRVVKLQTAAFVGHEHLVRPPLETTVLRCSWQFLDYSVQFHRHSVMLKMIVFFSLCRSEEHTSELQSPDHIV